MEMDAPWCAYSEDFACPFVPPENWLSVPIRAGEKEYPPAESREELDAPTGPAQSGGRAD